MLTLAVCLLGTISYNKLGTDLFPDLKNPALYVEVKSGQRPPEEVEKLITTNVESTAARQEGVKSVYSVTKVGYTKVTRGVRMGSGHGCRFPGFTAKCLLSFPR